MSRAERNTRESRGKPLAALAVRRVVIHAVLLDRDVRQVDVPARAGWLSAMMLRLVSPPGPRTVH